MFETAPDPTGRPSETAPHPTGSRPGAAPDPTGRPSEVLREIGPQAPGESGVRARIRFHQSWYRRHILGLPRYGSTEPHSGGRAMGSILHPDDAAAGRNFTTPAAERLYLDRRRAGWGVDPVRCTGYLTSSQALTINLLAPLKEDPAWAARVLSGLLDREITAVSGLEIEYAPRRRSLHLGDMTRLDAWIRLETGSGPQGLALEIKYADRFSSRHLRVAENPRYRELARTTGLWDLDDERTRSRPVNQLLRCHALATHLWLDPSSAEAWLAEQLAERPMNGPADRRTERAVDRAADRAADRTVDRAGSDDGPKTPPTVLVLHHPDDRSAPKTVGLYRDVLTRPELLKVSGLDGLVSRMAATADSAYQRTVAQDLRIRYLDHGPSDESWEEHRITDS